MRQLLIPIIAYLALAVPYLALSNAPVRVHVVSLLILAVAFLVPALSASFIQSRSRRLATCGAFALIAMILWDASAHLVVSKVAPFSILLGTPSWYVGGLLFLVFLSYMVAWLAAPPNNSFKPTPLRGAA